MILPVLIAAAAPPVPPGFEASSKPDVLIFEFPDGVRGGRGKVTGNLKWDSARNDPPMEKTIANCGGRNVRFSNNVSHRVHYTAEYAADPLQIAACVKRSTWSHFSVGLLTKVQGGVMPTYDEKPFETLWDRNAAEPSKTN